MPGVNVRYKVIHKRRRRRATTRQHQPIIKGNDGTLGDDSSSTAKITMETTSLVMKTASHIAFKAFFTRNRPLYLWLQLAAPEYVCCVIHHSKNSLSTQKMWNMSRHVAQHIFLRSVLVEFRVGCSALLWRLRPLLDSCVWSCSRIAFRYPWQGKLRRKACLAKWVHLSLIHLPGDCNIYASFEMQRMQDLRPVESQAVCTITGVQRRAQIWNKLCRYARRVIYEIYKCDALWPGNEWCKLESTKNRPWVQHPNCQEDSKWHEGKDCLKAFLDWGIVFLC